MTCFLIKMVKYNIQAWGPVQCHAFVCIMSLDGEPEETNNLLLKKKHVSVVFATLRTQYMHINPQFITKRECWIAFHNDSCLDFSPLVGL